MPTKFGSFIWNTSEAAEKIAEKLLSITERQCAAIHGKILSGDVSGTIAHQELGHLTQVAGVTVGVQRHPVQNFSAPGLRPLPARSFCCGTTPAQCC